MLKVVCDTNVLVSSLLSEHGNPGRIVDGAIEKRLINHTSPDMLKEFARVLKEYLEFSEEDTEKAIGLVLGFSVKTNPTEKINAVKDDPKDDIVLECAVACNADYIVSGDRHLVSMKQFRSIKILKPAEFIKLIEFDSALAKAHEHAKKHKIAEKDMWSAIRKARKKVKN